MVGMNCPGMSRRSFLLNGVKTLGVFVSGLSFPLLGRPAWGNVAHPVAYAKGENPAENVRKAVEILGGMRSFVSTGDVVLVKPNIGWDRYPEQAANTDPRVVVTLVELALQAGAKRVRVFDRTCNEPRRCYVNSGIQGAIYDFKKKNRLGDEVEIYHTERRKFVRVEIPGAEVLKGWKIYRDALEVDKIINVPVAKHHTLAKYTLSLKNMMGIMGDNRGQIHWELSRALADLNGYVKTDLAVVDGTRILLRNGPSGGNLADVERRDTIVVSPNPVSADAAALRLLFGVDPRDVPHVFYAAKRGLGTIDGQADILTGERTSR